MIESSGSSDLDAGRSEPARVAELTSFLKNLQGFKVEEPGSSEAVAFLALARFLCLQLEFHRAVMKQKRREDSDSYWNNKAADAADVMNLYYTLWRGCGEKDFPSLEQTKEVLKARADGREWSKVSTQDVAKITKLTHTPYEMWTKHHRSGQQDKAFTDMALGDILFFNFYFYNKIQVKAGSDEKPNSAKPSEQANKAFKEAYMSAAGSKRVGSA